MSLLLFGLFPVFFLLIFDDRFVNESKLTWADSEGFADVVKDDSTLVENPVKTALEFLQSHSLDTVLMTAQNLQCISNGRNANSSAKHRLRFTFQREINCLRTRPLTPTTIRLQTEGNNSHHEHFSREAASTYFLLPLLELHCYGSDCVCLFTCSCSAVAPPWAAAPGLLLADLAPTRSRDSCSPSCTLWRPCQKVSHVSTHMTLGNKIELGSDLKEFRKAVPVSTLKKKLFCRNCNGLLEQNQPSGHHEFPQLAWVSSLSIQKLFSSCFPFYTL